MTLCRYQPERDSHLWAVILSSIAAIVLFEPTASLAAAQNPQNSPAYASQRSTAVPPPSAAKESSQGRSNVSSSGNRDTPTHATHAVQPAAVTLKNGTLTIEANNSDLSQILRDVSRESGMIIQGPVRDTRVFGSYGPRNPRDILSELLAGLGYNIIMVGNAREGAPRELVLTTRPDGPVSAPTVKVPEKPMDDEPGPGAIAHPPPAPTDDPQTRSRQNLRRLEQMHESQERGNVP